MCTFAGNTNSREDRAAAKSPSGAPSVNFAVDTDMELHDANDLGMVQQDVCAGAGTPPPSTGAVQGLEDVYGVAPHVCPPSGSDSMISYTF
jgi:hypothetical protein